MLPDFRQFCAITILTLSVLVFAFGAAGILRTAHEDFSGLQFWNAGREPGLARYADRTRMATSFVQPEPVPLSLSVLEVTPAVDRIAEQKPAAVIETGAAEGNSQNEVKTETIAAAPAQADASAQSETAAQAQTDVPVTSEREDTPLPMSSPAREDDTPTIREAKAEAKSEADVHSGPGAKAQTEATPIGPAPASIAKADEAGAAPSAEARPARVRPASTARKPASIARPKARRVQTRRRVVRRTTRPPAPQQAAQQFVNPFEAIFGKPFQAGTTTTTSVRR